MRHRIQELRLSSSALALCGFSSLALALLASAQAPAAAPAAPASTVQRESAPARLAHEVAPKELFEVERVVDGDTIWVKRNGEIAKLRLHSVDTEERLGKGHTASATKPQTVFGEETALWAQKIFDGIAKEGEKPKVGILFAGGREQSDAFGRLLCHVLLPDGRDYNLMLVREGKSPYFNKYGNDEICHAAFVAAQAAAQEHHLGIWDPATNHSSDASQPSAIRPYSKLLPWWNERALAVDGFRARKAAEPTKVCASEDSAALTAAAKGEAEIEVFGEVGKVFDEKSGDQTVLLRGKDEDHQLRVRIPMGARKAHEELRFADLASEFHQNYVYVRGRVRDTGRGFEMTSDSPQRWKVAGASAAQPAAAPAGAR